jgi:hypothetical protein
MTTIKNTPIIKKISFIFTALTLFAVPQIHAVRPFITDDATLIGHKRSELANWTFINNATAEFWHSYSIGLSDKFEIAVAAFWGYSKPVDNHKEFSYTLPLLQGKLMLREYTPNGMPGITLAFGSDMPFGKGAFVPSGYGAFAFLPVTQCFGEDENVLIHANIGGTYLREGRENLIGLTWGTGTQIKVYKGLHGIAEIVSGDPYVHGAGFAYQLGLRHFVNDFLQFDLAFGKGLGGENRMPSWVSGGIRYVFDKSKGKKFTGNGRKIP